MLKELIKEADTVEAAVELAAVELNVSVEELEVEVLQEPQKKAFGLFGGTPAKVKVTVKGGSPAEAAVAFLKKVLATMGVTQVEITVK